MFKPPKPAPPGRFEAEGATVKKPGFGLHSLIDGVGCVAFAALLLMTLFNIASDWIYGRRYGQVEEIVSALFVWVVYVGAGLIYKRREHMSIDLFYNLLPKRAQAVMTVVIDALSLLISGVIAYYALLLTIKSTNKFTSVTKIPYVYIDLAVVIGFATLIYYIVRGWVAGSGKAGEAEGRPEKGEKA